MKSQGILCGYKCYHVINVSTISIIYGILYSLCLRGISYYIPTTYGILYSLYLCGIGYYLPTIYGILYSKIGIG